MNEPHFEVIGDLSDETIAGLARLLLVAVLVEDDRPDSEQADESEGTT